MKAVPSMLVAAIVVVGCTPSKGIESELKSSKAQNVGSTAGSPPSTPTSATTTSTTGSPSTAAGTSPASRSTGDATSSAKVSTPPAEDTSHDIADRAFQLRSLQHSPIKVNGHTIDAWVMDTEPKRGEGMMFLKDKDVREDQGMIFVFDGPQTQKNGGFYMKNTLIPLDIIYIGATHKVLNIQEGKPLNEATLPASGAYSDVLELKQGQAAKLGIKPGTEIDIPKDLKTPSPQGPGGMPGGIHIG